MKCPYRIYKKEYPDSFKKETIITEENFAECYEGECPFWRSVDECGHMKCGKAIAEMTTTKNNND